MSGNGLEDLKNIEENLGIALGHGRLTTFGYPSIPPGESLRPPEIIFGSGGPRWGDNS